MIAGGGPARLTGLLEPATGLPDGAEGRDKVRKQKEAGFDHARLS
jgi:hypothetical protein